MGPEVGGRGRHAREPIGRTPHRGATLTRSAENRGIVWVVAAFVLCPCHLPLTPGLAATLLAGTAAGSMVAGHPVLAGAVITLAWAAATWRGVHLMRSAGAPRCDCPAR